MTYADIRCGMRVRLPDGRTGEVTGYDASFALTFAPGGFTRRGTRGLRARVRVKGGETVEALIASLRPVRGRKGEGNA
jgi:hypothetical protein